MIRVGVGFGGLILTVALAAGLVQVTEDGIAQAVLAGLVLLMGGAATKTAVDNLSPTE